MKQSEMITAVVVIASIGMWATDRYHHLPSFVIGMIGPLVVFSYLPSFRLFAKPPIEFALAALLAIGCFISINPDAHDTSGLVNQKWGVIVARKGGVPPERVLNCFDLAGISAHFEKRKSK